MHGNSEATVLTWHPEHCDSADAESFVGTHSGSCRLHGSWLERKQQSNTSGMYGCKTVELMNAGIG